MDDLTPARLDILRFIQHYIKNTSWSPTVREVAAGTGYSSASVHYHLLQLEKASLIERNETGRQMRLTHKGRKALVIQNERARQD